MKKPELAKDGVQDFAKELFRLWDHKQFGKIQLRVLISNFIALGLASNEQAALDVTVNRLTVIVLQVHNQG